MTVHRQIYQQQVRHVKQLIIEEKQKYFNEKISNCKNSKTLFSVESEMKGTANRNPLPTNTPTKDLPDVFEELFDTKVSKIRESLNNDSDRDSHNYFK